MISCRYARTGEVKQVLMAQIDSRLVPLLTLHLSPADLAAARRQGERWSEDDAAEFLRRQIMV